MINLDQEMLDKNARRPLGWRTLRKSGERVARAHTSDDLKFRSNGW